MQIIRYYFSELHDWKNNLKSVEVWWIDTGWKEMIVALLHSGGDHKFIPKIFLLYFND